MEFLKCHVDGTRYGPGEMEKQDQYTERIETPQGMPPFDDARCQFGDNRLAKETLRAPAVNEFATLLSVCHSIIPEYPNGRSGTVVYNASSPDEKALVLFAKNLHYYFYDGHVQMLEVQGHDATI